MQTQHLYRTDSQGGKYNTKRKIRWYEEDKGEIGSQKFKFKCRSRKGDEDTKNDTI